MSVVYSLLVNQLRYNLAHTQCNLFNYRPRLRGWQLNSTGVFDKYALGRTSPAGRSYA